MLKILTGFILAVLVTYVIAVIFISQGNLAQVESLLGITAGFGVRVDAALHDIKGMTGLYLPLVTIALIIAFGVAALIIRFLVRLRLTGFALAGFVGLIALHVIMEQMLGLSGVAPTRFLSGLLLQGVAGAVGGLVFHFATGTNRSAMA